MSTKLVTGLYLVAAAVSFFLVLWFLKRPGSEKETPKDLSVPLPVFHHRGAYISAALVAVPLVYLAFSNYSIGTTRQWWLLDMFNARGVKPYEEPMRLPAEGALSTQYVANYDRYSDEANAMTVPEDSDLVHGERMFNTYCAPCHAKGGVGNGPVAMQSKTIPGVGLQGTGMQPAGYIYLTIRNGGAIMPAYNWAMNDKEMWDVVAYLRSLYPAPAPVASVEE